MSSGQSLTVRSQAGSSYGNSKSVGQVVNAPAGYRAVASFSSFSFASGDYFYIYAGTSTSGTAVLGATSGGSRPSSSYGGLYGGGIFLYYATNSATTSSGAQLTLSLSACSAGYYCPNGAVSPIQCPAGFYCTAAVTSAAACSTGYFCPAGSTSGTARRCSSYLPSVTGATSTMPTSATALFSCVSGYYGGSSSVTCTTSGGWPSISACQVCAAGAPAAPQNGQRIQVSTTVWKWTCNPGGYGLAAVRGRCRATMPCHATTP
jgi:hypothetical protein